MRINRAIRGEQVRVIAEDGKQLGIMSAKDALHEAEKRGKDLIEISPQANPPVCKIMDYGKFRYHQTKKEKESKKAQHQVKIKEIKLKPNIDVHDFSTKKKHAREFIEKGHKVRVTCMFRGREMLHKELGEKLVSRMCQDLEDIALIEAPIKQMGRIITIVLAPIVMSKKTKK